MRMIFLTGILLCTAGVLATRHVREHHAKSIADLKENGVDNVAVGPRISLKIQPRLSCEHGDLDAIKEDLSNDRKSGLLVSIEPVLPGDSSFKPVTRRVSQKGLFAGGLVNLDLPATDSATHLGLFICKDNSREGRCAGKQFHNLTKLQDRYFFQDARIVNDLKARDKVYYFQYLVIDRGSMTFLTKENSFDSVKAQIDRMVASYRPAGRRKHLATTVKNNLLKLTSVPIEVQERNHRADLSVILPGYDEKGCLPEVTRLKKKIKRVSVIQRLPQNLLPELR